MFQFSIASQISESAIDAHADHLLVLNSLLNRRDNAFTPYLFSAFQYGDQRWYCIQADRYDIEPAYHEKREPVPSLLGYSSENNYFSFYMRLNPAIKRTLVDTRRGKYDRLVPIKDVTEATHWMKSKLLDNGLAVLNSTICYQQATPCSRGNTFIHDTLFHAEGYVINPDKFEHLQISGFGKRKGYGFGMIMPQGTFGYTLLNKIYTL